MPDHHTVTSDAADSEDLILAQFMLDLEKHGPTALDDYSHRYPHLGDKLRSFLAKQERLERALQVAQAGPAPAPQKLGDFRILRRIGAGGMGEVYLAEQERLHRKVVVKVMRHVHGFSQSRERFVREQEVLARLEQAHIVPIITSGEDGGSPYFVMRHIDGAGLDHVIQAAQQWQSTRAEHTPNLSALANRPATTAAENAQASTLVLHPERRRSVSAEIPHGHARGGVEDPDAHGNAKSNKPRRCRLSMEYFRSVAQVMVDVAEAVQHAHSVGILHRDLKPSNLILDKSGQCWVIDFGLAGLLQSPRQESVERAMGISDRSPLLTEGALGTPQYMAPEQYEGVADVRSDVWGLGATLYELLTLQRAFPGQSRTEIQRQVCSDAPVLSTDRIRNVPRDLTAICLKALQKDRAKRYASAGEIAADLRSWLDHRPTTVRPARVIRQLGLWYRRNTAWAAAISCCVLATVTMIWGIISNEQAKTAAAEQREKEQQFQTQLLKLERDRLGRHDMGWSARLVDNVGDLVEQYGKDRLRDTAAATLNGLDGQNVLQLPFVSASAVAFDASGTKILVGGSPEGTRFSPVTRACVRETVTGNVTMVSDQPGPGPVAFDEDGSPLHVAADENDAALLKLWNIGEQRLVREFRIPAPEDFRVARSSLTLALTPTGSLLGASAALENVTTPLAVDEKQPTLSIVWDTRSGQVIRQMNSLHATALAFTHEGNWLATGDKDGNIQAFPLPQGEPISWSMGRLSVESLAFGHDVRKGTERGRSSSWLLASGDASGEISIWDSQAQKTASCRGSTYHVFALAFSPDNMTLASAGRGGVTKLWDVATGDLILHVPSADFATQIAFDPDGQQIAITTRDGFGRAELYVHHLEYGRGVQTLRGLRAPPIKTVFSPDGRWAAALAANWEAAIWDLRTGSLRHLFETPVGLTADNASVAFSPDGNLFACSTGSGAELWDVASGQQLKIWKLPPGLVDNLAFHPQGNLLLFRVETTDGRPPYGNSANDHPRVCRVRDLLAAAPLQPLYELKVFTRPVKNALFTYDGKYLFVSDAAGKDETSTLLKAYNGLTGTELWSNNRFNVDNLRVDPAGNVLLANDTSHPSVVGHLLEPSSGRETQSCQTPSSTGSLSPQAEYSIHGNSTGRGVVLCPEIDKAGLVTLAMDLEVSTSTTFDRNGSHLAVATMYGQILIYDLPEVRRRLALLGLEW